ncbi:metallophosphoesterase [Shewanella sp.]|uniref:metallophosphoesterase n=1 Tax=Shewanella sp. TaxID=50422 RepID=UPI0035619E74
MCASVFNGVGLALVLGVALVTFTVQAEVETTTVFHDGPYVIDNEHSSADALWICNSELKKTPGTGQLTRPEHCGELPQPLLHAPYSIDADSFSDVRHVVALSDVHGQYDVLLKLLRAHKVIDENNRWALGEGHLVMTGDMFDRGHQINEVLWFMYGLDKQARDAGGMMHLLMGNHEQMVLQGDLRYIHERYQQSSELIGRSYDALYDQDTEIGKWLRSKNTVAIVNDMLFMHGGISPEWLERGLSIGKANDLYRKHIDDERAELKANPLLNFLFFKGGPTWYRGYFKDELSSEQIDGLLKHFGVNHIVVGHTSQERVLGLFNNRIIAIDSSIKLGKSGELLSVEDGKLLRGKFDGSRSELVSD